MASDYKIFWTEEAIENLEEILEYLKNRWTQKEIDNLKLCCELLVILSLGSSQIS